jgi:hypothetical protein
MCAFTMLTPSRQHPSPAEALAQRRIHILDRALLGHFRARGQHDFRRMAYANGAAAAATASLASADAVSAAMRDLFRS